MWPGFGGGGEGDPQEGRLLQTSLTKAERFMTPPLAHPGPQAPLSLNMRMGDLDRAGAVSAAVLWARGAVVWASHPLQPCEENPRHSGAPRTPDLLLASQRTGSAEAKPPLAFSVTLGHSSLSLNFSVSLHNDEVGMGVTR